MAIVDSAMSRNQLKCVKTQLPLHSLLVKRFNLYYTISQIEKTQNEQIFKDKIYFKIYFIRLTPDRLNFNLQQKLTSKNIWIYA